MSGDEELFQKKLRIENKDFFVDLKRNANGLYLKISERQRSNRNTIMIPISGLEDIVEALNDAIDLTEEFGTEVIPIVQPVARSAVAIAKKPAEAAPAAAPASAYQLKTVFARAFPKGSNAEEVTNHMKSAGKVVLATKLKANPKAKTESYIVEYSSVAGARKALSTLNNSDFNGNSITVREDNQPASSEPAATAAASAVKTVVAAEAPRREKAAKEDPAEKIPELGKVFISNLSFDTTPEELKSLLDTVGKVSTVDVRYNKRGRSLGNAIVEFSNPAGAQAAIVKLNDTELGGRVIQVRQFFQ